MIGGIYPTTVVPTKATPPPVNFDTVNQEQASANRARPRPDAINFGRSTMMEPFGGIPICDHAKRKRAERFTGNAEGKRRPRVREQASASRSRV